MLQLVEEGGEGKALEQFEDKRSDSDCDCLRENDVMAVQVASQSQRNPLLEEAVGLLHI